MPAPTPHRPPVHGPGAKRRPRGARPTPKERRDRAPKFTPRRAVLPSFAVIPPTLLDWLNLVDGDCVTAEEAWAKAVASIMAGQPELLITDATVQTWAMANGVLQGADLGQVLDLMAHTGFAQGGQVYGDGPAVQVDYTSPSTLQAAICEGPVKLGVVGDPLENVVGSTNGWLLTGVPQQSASNEDHCIGVSGYGTMQQLAATLGVPLWPAVRPSDMGWLCFTWGTMGVIEAASFQAMTFEAWLRSPTTVVQSGPTPPPTPPPGGMLGLTVPTSIPAGSYQLLAVPAAPLAVTLSPVAAALLQALLGELESVMASDGHKK
jgi:hypothetical protein